MRPVVLACLVLALAACGHTHGGTASDAAPGARDAASGGGLDAMRPGSDAALPGDGASASGDAGDAGAGGLDAGLAGNDAAIGGADAGGGVLTGGPCLSGAPGQTAYRIRWIDGGGTAEVSYEVDGLPDTSRDHAGAYGYEIGFTPSFVDPYLGDGGVQLDDSDFIDLELSTAGLSSITKATLSIYGRSYDTTASGSFSWQTFVGTGATDVDAVSNVAPYQWYSADMTTEITPGDPMVLIRIKAGPASDSLVVNRVELCLQAS